MSPISITLRAYMVPDTMDVSGMGHVAFTCVVFCFVFFNKENENPRGKQILISNVSFFSAKGQNCSISLIQT